MLKMLILLMFVVILIAPLPVQAAPIACNETLRGASFRTAILDPDPEISGNGFFTHWQYTETPYRVEAWSIVQWSGIDYIFEIWRGKKLVGKYQDSNWSVCRGGNGWKNYVLSHVRG